MKAALLAIHRTGQPGQRSNAQLHLRDSSADLAHALIIGTTELAESARAQILAALQRHGPVHTQSAAYVMARLWAEAVRIGARPPNPIVFRSLGRDADWLAALEFVLSALAVFEDAPSRSVRRPH